MTDQEIIFVARKVRRWLRRHIRKTKQKDTCGLYAVATAKLYKELKNEDVEPVVIKSCMCGSHAFLVWNNKDEKFIIDVTADQFGEKPIEFRKLDCESPWYWGGDFYDGEDDHEGCDFVSGLKDFKKEVKRWDEEQNPFKCGIKI